MQGLGHYSNPSAPLVAVLSAFPDGVPDPCPTPIVLAAPKRQRYGNGIVLRAVRRVCEESDEPMAAFDVLPLVEQRLGGPVSIKTIRSCLKREARGPDSRLVRTSLGRYQRKASGPQ
jgi:hypothetical protein